MLRGPFQKGWLSSAVWEMCTWPNARCPAVLHVPRKNRRVLHPQHSWASPGIKADRKQKGNTLIKCSFHLLHSFSGWARWGLRQVAVVIDPIPVGCKDRSESWAHEREQRGHFGPSDNLRPCICRGHSKPCQSSGISIVCLCKEINFVQVRIWNNAEMVLEQGMWNCYLNHLCILWYADEEAGQITE